MNARMPAVLAAVLGGLGGWILRAGIEPDPATVTEPPSLDAERTAEPDVPPKEEHADLIAPPGTGDPESDDRLAVSTEVDFWPPLLAFAREGIPRGWRGKRSDEIPGDALDAALLEFEETVRKLPERIGSSLARDANARDEAAATGEGFAILLDLMKGGEPRLDLAGDRKAMEELFAREAPEFGVGALDHLRDPGAPLSDGATLQFPPGVFRVDDRKLMKKKPFPRDVTITGAGRNATLLITDNLSTRDKLRNLTIRDCTIQVADGLFDLRHEPALIKLERVRIVGFDCGHGGCDMLAAPGMALLAIDCEFLGGYGGHWGSDSIFDAHTQGYLARFDGCTFADVSLGLDRIRSNATVAFHGCRILDVLDPVEAQADSKPGVVLSGCQVIYAPKDAEPKSMDLNDLFPDWKKRIE